MISKKKAAKKPAPAKQAKKPAKPTTKKSHKKSPKKPVTKGSKPMTENQPTTAPQISAVEALLMSIATKLDELVAIESYCAKKIAEKYEAPVQPAPVAAVAAEPASVASIAAAPAPAQTAAPSVPASRPGAGTVGGMVWDYCDGLTQQLGHAPTKDELIAAIKAYSPNHNGQPVNELTASTQYSKWRAAQGLPRLPRGFGANRPAAAPAPAPAAAAPAVAPVVPPALPFPAPLPVAPVQTAMALPLPAPLPAAAVPSVINPTAAPAPSLPPWLRAVQ
jgi:hypothetical protein